MSDLLENIKVKEDMYLGGDIDEDALGPWSYSKMKLLRSCPLQFYMKYMLKVKVPTAPISLVTEVGKAAHRLVELSGNGKPLSEVYKEVRAEFANVLTQAEWEEHVETLEMSIQSFQDRMAAFNAVNPIKRQIHELKIGCTKAWTPTGFFSNDVFYRGVIDLSVLLENKDALFIDHKTGAPAAIGLRHFNEQLDTYKVLFHHGVQKIEGAQSGVHFIRDGQVTMGEYHDAHSIETKLRHNVASAINVAIDAVKDKGKFAKAPSGTTACKYCDYAAECKKGLLKGIEKETARLL